MKRSKFNLSYSHLLSCDQGELIPIGLTEVLPGDTFQHTTSALIRCSPMLAPVMHPVHARIHHFFVPHRLVWANFDDFITGGPDGLNNSVPPTINWDGTSGANGKVGSYYGLPSSAAQAYDVSALPIRGYALIWNEYYRDQDLQTALTIPVSDGADNTISQTLQNVCWEKDYFTSARPWATKGAAITLPLGTSAPVIVKEGASTRTFERSSVNAATSVQVNEAGGAQGTDFSFTADLSTASSVSINVLREALALQRYQEARARYGSRYTEYLRYLGIKSSDARIQRPEYLGGGKQVLQFSEVLQTSGNATPAADDQLGQLGGHGIGALRSNRYRRFFEEHGFIHSLLSVKPKTMYMNGVARHWNRTTKEDYWQKELQFIGQQEILNKEIYANLAAGTAANQRDGTFGYQDRYDEYRRSESRISGEFRDSSLNFWHFARSFGSQPTLNSDFVKAVPTETPFAVPSTDVLWVMVKHSIQARRMVAPVGVSKTF